MRDLPTSQFILPRAATALVLLLLAKTRTLARAMSCEDEDIMPSGMDMNVFTALFVTETESEFVEGATTAAAEMWNSASRFEWCRAMEQGHRKFPYMICIADDEHAPTASGYHRRRDLLEVLWDMQDQDERQRRLLQLQAAGSNDDHLDVYDDDHGRMYYPPLYNGDSLYCVSSSMFASEAVEMSASFQETNRRQRRRRGRSIMIQPYMMPMKMMPRTVDEIQERMTPVETLSLDEEEEPEGGGGGGRQRKRQLRRQLNNESDDSQRVENSGVGDGNPNGGPYSERVRNPLEALPSFDALICPGVLSMNPTQEEQDALLRDLDIFLGGGEEEEEAAAAAAAEEEAQQQQQQEKQPPDDPFSGLVNALFWISSGENNPQEDEGPAEQGQGQGTTQERGGVLDRSRSQHWHNVLGMDSEHQSTCYTAFREDLIWTLGSFSSQTTEASLHVEFNSTDMETDNDEDQPWSRVTTLRNRLFPPSLRQEDVETRRDCVMMLVMALGLHPAVCHVEVRHVSNTLNAQAQWLIQSGVEGERPWFDVGLDGRGQVIAISDTGVDTDNCYFWDANQPIGEKHRKIVEYRPFVNGVDFPNGHGTHVTATAMGRRAVDGTVESTGLADGVAREARLAFADIGDSNGNLRLPADDFTMLETGRRMRFGPQAHIHSASWGAVGINFYTVQARNFDQFMVENEDFLILAAAGNDGKFDVPGSITSPATAKNVIAVGASHSYGDDLESGQKGPRYIADFSSRGPTADGRTKPEVVAPGKFILSAGANPSVVGECDADGANPPRPGGSSNGLLSIAGTSMATPATAATAAMIRQYFEEGFHPTGERNENNTYTPSGALIKAVLLNGGQNQTAVDNGRFETPVTPYDNTQNFGRISLVDSLYIAGKSNVQTRMWDREVVTDDQTQTWNVAVNKTNGCKTQSLSATLVWVDAASAPGCRRCLLNDLDLLVERVKDGRQYFPNGLNRPDRINTAERVQVHNLQDGDEFRIMVRGANLATRRQPYSLVVTGCFGGQGNRLVGRTVFDERAARTGMLTGLALLLFLSLTVYGSYRWWKRRSRAAASIEAPTTKHGVPES